MNRLHRLLPLAIVVDATLCVVHHPRIVVGPVDVKSFTEHRLADAARVGP